MYVCMYVPGCRTARRTAYVIGIVWISVNAVQKCEMELPSGMV